MKARTGAICSGTLQGYGHGQNDYVGRMPIVTDRLLLRVQKSQQLGTHHSAAFRGAAAAGAGAAAAGAGAAALAASVASASACK